MPASGFIKFRSRYRSFVETGEAECPVHGVHSRWYRHDGLRALICKTCQRVRKQKRREQVKALAWKQLQILMRQTRRRMDRANLEWKVSYPIPEGMEPKYMAISRLKREGCYEEFRARVRWYRNTRIVTEGKRSWLTADMNRIEAFYAALQEFMPIMGYQ